MGSHSVKYFVRFWVKYNNVTGPIPLLKGHCSPEHSSYFEVLVCACTRSNGDPVTKEYFNALELLSVVCCYVKDENGIKREKNGYFWRSGQKIQYRYSLRCAHKLISYFLLAFAKAFCGYVRTEYWTSSWRPWFLTYKQETQFEVVLGINSQYRSIQNPSPICRGPKWKPNKTNECVSSLLLVVM